VPAHLHRVHGPLFVVVGLAEARREREWLAAVSFAGFFDVARVVFLPARPWRWPLWTGYRRRFRKWTKGDEPRKTFEGKETRKNFK